jgi:hypothetical protein
MLKYIASKEKKHCYTIEFEKRVLPHAHILLWLEVKPNVATFDD